MNDKVFIDTNVWIYLYAINPQEKHEKARQLVDEAFDSIMVSSQVMGEIYHVLTRKGFQSPETAKETVKENAAAFPILEIGIDHVLKAIDINHRYQYSYWDSLVIATALLYDCRNLYSEDMRHGQLIEDKLRIINPFRPNT